jgi:hypothetical protein
MGIDWATDGHNRPDIPAIRRRMGKEGFQTTTTADAERCVESLGLRYQRHTGRSSLSALKNAVRDGHFVQLAIKYGVLNDRLRRTGDPNFRDGHSIGVLGQRTYRGELQWMLYDPLDDHRRSSIPQGPRWVAASAIIAACEGYGGFFGIFMKQGGHRG